MTGWVRLTVANLTQPQGSFEAGDRFQTLPDAHPPKLSLRDRIQFHLLYTSKCLVQYLAHNKP